MIVPQEIYHPLYEDKEKFIILITGGRGSGKSFNASTFIERLTFEMTPVEKIVLRDSEGNLTGEDELQVSESELAPNLQAMSVWLYHHDEDWRKVERKQDEDADIPTDIEHGINIDSWIKDKLK